MKIEMMISLRKLCFLNSLIGLMQPRAYMDLEQQHYRYYAFDDDGIKGGDACRRISDHRLNFQNCNNFHEQNVVQEGMTFLG